MFRSLCLRLSLALALLAAALSPAVRAPAAYGTAALPSPQALDSLLTTTLRPPRDLYALTTRLKLHTTTPLDPYVNQVPPHYTVGSTARFYVSNDQETGYVTATATLVLTTAHAYFYVQNGFKYEPAAIARSAEIFEHSIYPTDRSLFGQEWTPGVDDDPHISIFNGHLPPSAAGYFSGEDLFPRAVNPYSNQRKMIFMSLAALTPGSSGYDEVLAHEFQHMIHFHLHPADEAWINEGDSILAQELNGYSDSGYALTKAGDPGAQLDAWSAGNSAPYYGGGYMWMLYCMNTTAAPGSSERSWPTAVTATWRCSTTCWRSWATHSGRTTYSPTG